MGLLSKLKSDESIILFMIFGLLFSSSANIFFAGIIYGYEQGHKIEFDIRDYGNLSPDIKPEEPGCCLEIPQSLIIGENFIIGVSGLNPNGSYVLLAGEKVHRIH